MNFEKIQYMTSTLVTRDFKIRYRNMSLGVLWSVANPLIMTAVLTFVFTRIFPNPSVKGFPAFVLCALVPFNFFSAAWQSGTASIVANAALIKRMPIPNEIIPLAAVLANCVHLGIQATLLLTIAVAMGLGVSLYWLWVPVILVILTFSVCGLAMFFTSFDVYFRDTRYIVESALLIMFWLTPIFYPIDMVPPALRWIYLTNPVASATVSLRNIIMLHQSPSSQAMMMSLVSATAFSIIGFLTFHKMKSRFADYL